MSDDNTYKIKIDKEILTTFLLDKNPPTKEQMAEVHKVFTVVLIKHFNNFLSEKEDLFSYAWVAVLARRKNYKVSFSSYSYIYTIARNEIGNNIKRYSKEDLVDDFVTTNSTSPMYSVDTELPPELNKFKTYLTGEQEFSTLELRPAEAFHLCAFVLCNTSFRTKRVPDFIKEKKEALEILYKTTFLLIQ